MRAKVSALTLIVGFCASCRAEAPPAVVAPEVPPSGVAGSAADGASSPVPVTRSVALLAGGCFWGMQELLRKLPGVAHTSVGYTGGVLRNPRYEDVHTGTTQHAEAVRVEFDPRQLSYERLLAYFFSIHDPTTENRQGNDVGTQYRSAIFVLDSAQRETAKRVIERVAASGDWKRPITTQVVDATEFYPAEGYHQDYLQKNPGGYTCHFQRKVSYY